MSCPDKPVKTWISTAFVWNESANIKEMLKRIAAMHHTFPSSFEAWGWNQDLVHLRQMLYY